jgi:hypothetical protein
MGEAIFTWWFLRLGFRAIPSRRGRVLLCVITGMAFAGVAVVLVVATSFSIP